jgi:hypothetical protein
MAGTAKAAKTGGSTLKGRLTAGLRRCGRCVRDRGFGGLARAIGRRCARGLSAFFQPPEDPPVPPEPAPGPVPLTAFAGRATTFKLDDALLFTPQPQPWRAVARPVEEVNPIPSMIHPDESLLLYWLAAHYYRGEGRIVDLGPLAGGSAHSLAAGLADRKSDNRPRGQIDSYDFWGYLRNFQEYFPGQDLKPGDDLLGFFKTNLGPLLPYVTPHKGDLCSYPWPDDPIEILFIDAAKTPACMDFIARRLFPHLIPGRSIVIHQDYISATCPWIHLVMEHLRDSFEYVDSPEGGSVCFVPVRPIPENALPDDFFEALPVADARRRLRGARANVRGWYKLCLWLGEAFHLTQVGEYAQAETIVRQVRAHPDFRSGAQYDVDFVRAHLPGPAGAAGFAEGQRPAPAESGTAI